MKRAHPILKTRIELPIDPLPEKSKESDEENSREDKDPEALYDYSENGIDKCLHAMRLS
jgi:hypothetical protein